MFIFVSIIYPGIRAFTVDEAGDNLPAAYAPWRLADGGKAISVEQDDPVTRAIARDGFFLVTRGRASLPSGRSSTWPKLASC
jgi:hypothetical protein